MVRLEPENLAAGERVEHLPREMAEVGDDPGAPPAAVREDEAARFGAVVRRPGDPHRQLAAAERDLRPARDRPHVREERAREPARPGPCRRWRRAGGSTSPRGRARRARGRCARGSRGSPRRRRATSRGPRGGGTVSRDREAGVEQDGGPPAPDDGAVARGARAEEGDLDAHARPVLPKPPAPRAVPASDSAGSNAARATGATTSCAIRSPRAIVTGSPPRLTTTTPTSPR